MAIAPSFPQLLDWLFFCMAAVLILNFLRTASVVWQVAIDLSELGGVAVTRRARVGCRRWRVKARRFFHPLHKRADLFFWNAVNCTPTDEGDVMLSILSSIREGDFLRASRFATRVPSALNLPISITTKLQRSLGKGNAHKSPRQFYRHPRL
jgi:hypothetical protein